MVLASPSGLSNSVCQEDTNLHTQSLALFLSATGTASFSFLFRVARQDSCFPPFLFIWNSGRIHAFHLRLIWNCIRNCHFVVMPNRRTLILSATAQDHFLLFSEFESLDFLRTPNIISFRFSYCQATQSQSYTDAFLYGFALAFVSAPIVSCLFAGFDQITFPAYR